MMEKKGRYTLRIDEELWEKLTYVAGYEMRTKNREVEQIIKRHIAAFEKEHGQIDLPQK